MNLKRLDQKTTQKIIKIISYLGIILSIWAVWEMYRQGVFSDPQKLEHLVTRFGVLGPIVFILIQIIQVVIPIIPGSISLAAGVLMFGPWWGFVYNYVGIVLGSLILFGLGRKYGRRLVDIFVSPKMVQKYVEKLNTKQWTWIFAGLIFAPLAPDDALVLLTSISNMSWRTFTLIIVLGKPASIAIYSYAMVYGIDWLTKLLGG